MKQVRIEGYPELDYATNEAMNTLCTNIVFAGDEVRRVLVTSCREHEGKSFISMSIMHTLASMGYNVVLVDADLRRSVVASSYGIRFSEEPLGLSHYLSRKMPVDEVLYEADIPGNYIVPVGHDVMNSMQLLSSWRLKELLDDLAQRFDYVIVDTPPIGAIVDAAVVAKSCDAAVLVLSAGLATKKEVVEAKQQIEKSGCPVIGAVLNKVEMTRSSSKYYHRSMYTAYEAQGYYRRESEPTETSTNHHKRGDKVK